MNTGKYCVDTKEWQGKEYNLVVQKSDFEDLTYWIKVTEGDWQIAKPAYVGIKYVALSTIEAEGNPKVTIAKTIQYINEKIADHFNAEPPPVGDIEAQADQILMALRLDVSGDAPKIIQE